MKSINERDGFDLVMERYLGVSDRPHAELRVFDGSIVFCRDGFMRIYTPKKVEWTGEGPPPVGVEAEAYFHADTNPDWLPFTLKYFSEEHVVFRGPIGECHMSRCAFDKYGFKFRPIRTPEQIAAEEREAAVEAMLALDPYLPEKSLGMMSRADFCRALYDNDYRKQVKP